MTNKIGLKWEYKHALKDEIVRRLAKSPKKNSKLRHIAKLDKYHTRMKTGK